MQYTVESAGFLFKRKGKGYFKTQQLPAWRVVRVDGKTTHATTIREEAQSWCEMLNGGYRPTGIYI